MASVARLFDKKLVFEDDRTAAYALPDIIDNLFASILPEPVTMSTYGLTKEQAPKLADFIYENYQGDMGNYLKVPTREDIHYLVEQSM